MSDWTVVVPTIGRPSLPLLLASLASQPHRPAEVVVVDDRRPGPAVPPLDVGAYPGARVLASGGRGPAAARNVGRRVARTPWVVVLDDDVLLPDGWSAALTADLDAAGSPGRTGAGGLAEPGAPVAAVSGGIVVPLPAHRPATDWERTTAGLERARWATADMALRRDALTRVGGFDERFPRAYREDADLAARLAAAGYRLRQGRRHVVHPVRPADPWISVRTQRGNADDALMRAVHGARWRDRAQCPPGRLRRHALTTTAAAVALAALALRRPRAAAAAGAAWALLTGEFAHRRIAPGPRTPGEVATMIATSVAVPPAAVAWRLVGTWRHRGARPWAAGPRAGTDGEAPATVWAVLFDRDGTLVHDVPYNGDPRLVTPVDGAAEALDRLRAAGLAVGLVTNQSGVARGLISAEDADRVTARVVDLLGPFDTVQVCPHGPDDRCACRKPRPGMVEAAAAHLGVAPAQCVVVGDIGADVEAARAAGARAVLVPTPVTRPEEVALAGTVAPTLPAAVDLVLDLVAGTHPVAGSDPVAGGRTAGVP